VLIWLLIGLGLGVAVLMGLAAARDRRFRRLLADAHLAELGQALDAARAGTATTSEGLTLAWRVVGVHAALVVKARQRLGPELARFMLGVCARAVGRDITALLVLPDGSYGLVVPGPLPSVGAVDLAAWRTAGVEAMKGAPLVPGSLAAYG